MRLLPLHVVRQGGARSDADLLWIREMSGAVDDLLRQFFLEIRQ